MLLKSPLMVRLLHSRINGVVASVNQMRSWLGLLAS